MLSRYFLQYCSFKGEEISLQTWLPVDLQLQKELIAETISMKLLTLSLLTMNLKRLKEVCIRTTWNRGISCDVKSAKIFSSKSHFVDDQQIIGECTINCICFHVVIVLSLFSFGDIYN